MNKLNQFGDTIIEVMIAITVVGMALAGAFASINHSLIDVRDAQEHEVALTMAETQLELMNAHTSAELAGYIATYGTYCFDTSSIPAQPYSAITNHCQNQGTELYNVKISQVSSPGSPELSTYKVSIDWPGLNHNNDNVQAYYQPLGDN